MTGRGVPTAGLTGWPSRYRREDRAGFATARMTKGTYLVVGIMGQDGELAPSGGGKGFADSPVPQGGRGCGRVQLGSPALHPYRVGGSVADFVS